MGFGEVLDQMSVEEMPPARCFASICPTADSSADPGQDILLAISDARAGAAERIADGVT